MISATTEKEIELFIADVKKQLYIPDIARHYVSVIYDLILEYDHKPSSARSGSCCIWLFSIRWLFPSVISVSD